MSDPHDNAPASGRVVVVEDDPLQAESLAFILRQEGYVVELASTGAEALAVARSQPPPDTVLLDVALPDLSGVEVARRLRAGSNVPIIMLTARRNEIDKITGLDAGADDYVIKPFDAEELRARVAVGVRVLTLQERLAERVQELQAALSNVKQLHGLLPICSYCKRIRGDDQYWQQVEGYIAEHSDAQFSHGICPPCYEKVSAEIDELSRSKVPRQGA
jgi:phosphoserine phosphatase RsbU/P